jgi:hypothetical protein
MNLFVAGETSQQPISQATWLKVTDHVTTVKLETFSCLDPTHILRHINSFSLVLLDAFSSRFFKTNVLFLCTLFSSTYISFMFPLASVSFV